MMETSLEFYLISISKRRKKLELMRLDNFDEKGASLLTLAKKALEPARLGNVKYGLDKIIKISNFTENKIEFEGTMLVGQYGFENKVVDVLDGSTAFLKKTNHADQVPYYFRLIIPANGDKGVLILQRFGGGGIASIVRTAIRDEFSKVNHGYTLNIRPMAPDFVFDSYMKKGTARKITFIKHCIPSDFADQVVGKKAEIEGSVEITVTPKNNGLFNKNKFSEIFKNRKKVSDVYTFEGFEADEVKIKMDIGGKPRIVNLNNCKNLKTSFDISDEVTNDVSGYPKHNDLKLAAQDLLELLCDAIGVQI